MRWGPKMTKLDDLKNANSDIDFFDKLLGRAEKRVNDTASVELDFVQGIIKAYARQGDALDVTEAQLKRLNEIAGGAKLRAKPTRKPRKVVKKSKKKTVKRKVAANG